ncbi:MAG: hypothetical protein WCW14_03000 [Candidatus Paceibacterota bacterium]
MEKLDWVRESHFVDQVLSQANPFTINVVRKIAKAKHIKMATARYIINTLTGMSFLISCVDGTYTVNESRLHV